MKLLKYLLVITIAVITVSWGQKCCAQNASGCPKTEKKIALQMYSVRDTLRADFKGTIAALSQIGFKDLEAAGYSDGKFYGLTPEAFKSELEAVGLTALSSHTGHALAKNVSETDWDEVWKWWDTCIEAHKAVGMKYIVVASMAVPKSLADLKTYCNYFNQIGEKCNAAGIGFGYHNHDHEFQKIEGEVMYDFMLKNTDPEKVFFQMDVYWAVIGIGKFRAGESSPVEYFKKYPGRFTILHLKDYKELGESGMVGFDAIYRNIGTAGAVYSIIEVEKYDYDPLESVKMSLEYLMNAPF